MTLNQTFNEAGGCSPPSTPGQFNVRAFYTENDAGHLFGVFTTRERAEECVNTLAARPGVINATIEEVV